jgi:hypothetical protein
MSCARRTAFGHKRSATGRLRARNAVYPGPQLPNFRDATGG